MINTLPTRQDRRSSTFGAQWPNLRSIAIATAFLASVFVPGPVQAGEALPGPSALIDARAQVSRGMPTVLMFSLPGCAFCERLRAEQLIHLHRDAARIGVRVVELSMTDRRPIPGTEPPESPAAMARRLGVRLAPSVLFVSNEREIAPRLEGYGSPDFYGAYLDERTAQARQAIAEHVRR